MQRIRVVAALAAAAMVAAAAAPVAGVVDRVVPHEVQPLDIGLCTASTLQEHALIGVTGPVPEPGGGAVTILEVHPVGLQEGVGWRPWVVPAESDLVLSASRARPPAGWPDRVPPGEDAQATSARPVQVLLELWPAAGRRTTALRGVLIRYRTSLGLVRQVISPTSVTTRVGGCA